MSVAMEEIEALSICLEGERYSKEDLPRLGEIAYGSERQELVDLYHWLLMWWGDDEYMSIQTSGSTGTPKQMRVGRAQMIASAQMTCRTLGIEVGGAALLCMHLRYIGAQMMVVRAMVQGLNLIVRSVSSHPLKGIGEHIHFAAMVPLQVASMLEVKSEARLLAQVDVLLIGGGAIDPALEERLVQLPDRGRCYSSYGMTETLSHIALRPIGGNGRYYPLSGVKLSVSHGQRLIIEAPYLLDAPLLTNDIVDMAGDGGFTIVGRADHVINSGGVKIHPERVETLFKEHFPSLDLLLTSLPDSRLGEALVLLIELPEGQSPSDVCSRYFKGADWTSFISPVGHSSSHLGSDEIWKVPQALVSFLRGQTVFEDLPPYHEPKSILFVGRLPRLENGKLDRLAAKRSVQGAFFSDSI